MILWYLKKFGIPRRDSAEHVRKVTEEMVNGWVRRYDAGESLKQLAGDDLSPVSVFLHLRKRGIKLRDKIQAQIQAVSKHRKLPFDGDSRQSAYLLGFARGDLHVRTHGRSVRVSTSTTHPAMHELFVELFSHYGHVYSYPKHGGYLGFEWSMDADLDTSFGFLLGRDDALMELTRSEVEFSNYLAGFFDAEGSIWLHREGKYTLGYALSITNKDRNLLAIIKDALVARGYDAKLDQVGKGGLWRVAIWKKDSLEKFLRATPVRHREKKAKMQIVMNYFSGRADYAATLGKWRAVLSLIDEEKKDFVRRAERRSLSEEEQQVCRDGVLMISLHGPIIESPIHGRDVRDVHALQ